MSRVQQDQFVDDDEDECCPLCVEEFDLSDRNFRPCPCGYQICQFCFNNIKTTMNGLCPACRRPYDDSTIEWKTISPEEMARHKQQIAQKAKKNAQIRQKEAQKAEADSLSRKHLAGLRVVQKNLVYVTGLTPTIREDRLLDTLRGDDYFGQYGKIIKIVVSKARENAQHQQSVGVYVTFSRKQDAEACIKAVDGSQNGDRTLRAQYGTTKYCSAYLRGEQCNNRNCMFLHEPGEDNDSFTRQDLSMMNSIQTQQPSQSSTSRSAPPAHQGPPVAAAATPMNRQDSSDTSSPIQDAPGLPAHASWGNKAVLERRTSRSTIASNPSPMVPNAVPAPAPKAPKAEEPAKKKSKEKEQEQPPPPSTSAIPRPTTTPPARAPRPQNNCLNNNLLKVICAPDFKFVFCRGILSDEEFKAVAEFPLLLDPNGGAKRRAMREKEQELALQRESEIEGKVIPLQIASVESEENEATAGGSLQLGGEPEEGHELATSHLGHHAIAPPGAQGFGSNIFGQNAALTEDFSSLGLSSRVLTPQQQQQLLLSNFKAGAQSTGSLSNMQNSTSQQLGLTGATSGHTRHHSRFSFANDGASASANVQPVANAKLMNQQSSMMPKNATHYGQTAQHQSLGAPFFTNVQGPPPGLKSTGTPPVSGTGIFGQGHGFSSSGLGYGTNAAGRNNSDAMYQDLLRGRNLDGGTRLADAGKQESTLTTEEQASFNVDALVNDNDNDDLSEPVRGPQNASLTGPAFDHLRRATPMTPPGFTAPAIPRTLLEDSGSRSGSRPMSRTASSTITPAVPILPATPIRAATPVKPKTAKLKSDDVEISTTMNQVATKPLPKTPSKVPSRAIATYPRTPSEGIKRDGDDVLNTSKQMQADKLPAAIPLKDTPKGRSANRKSKTGAESSPKKELQTHDQAELVTATLPTLPTKRPPPGKLDIAAATKIPKVDQSPVANLITADPATKLVYTLPVPSNSSVPSSPAVPVTESPIRRSTAPRTLRVLPTPKTEVPPPLSAGTAPSLSQISTVGKLRSRQASIASINQPATPVSDRISDTASVTSTSFSRASSPPPIGGKVGTAPVRKKTKSQAKKDRQDRKRQIEEEQAMVEDDKSDVEVVQAPIIGRKKKAKKPASMSKPLAAAFKSQPASPKPETVEEEHSDALPITPSRKVSSAKVSALATPEPEPELEYVPDYLRERREHTAQSIMADLQRTGELLASTLEFFKPLSSSLTHTSRNSHSPTVTAPPDLRIHFSEADLEALAKKKSVRLNSHDGRPDSRTLITPHGKFFWGLTEELEQKALELEKHIEELKGHARYHPRKQTARGLNYNVTSQTQSKDVLPAIATALKEAGKKINNTNDQKIPKFDPAFGLGSTSTPYSVPHNLQEATEAAVPQLPPPPQQQTPADAGAYLNQFVLPRTDNPPPNQPRPEMAAVGGTPGAGTANLSVHVNKFAKAAKAVVEGGAVGGTEIDGMGMIAADLLGGVFVQGLEALVGAGLGLQSTQDYALDGTGNANSGLDVQSFMSALETTAGLGGMGYAVGGRRARGSVLSMEEAEQAMHAAKKEHDALEKKLATLMKKNKKLATGNGRAW